MLHCRTLFVLLLLPCGAVTANAQGLADVYVSDSTDDRIWLCTDADQNGDYNGASETTIFYDGALGSIPLSSAAAVWYASDGSVFVADTDEDLIVRLLDLDADGSAMGPGEATLWFDGTAGGNAEGVEMASGRGLWRDPDGVFYVASNNTTSGGHDAILRLEDVNQDGDANDVGESKEFYLPSVGGSVGDSIPTAIVRGADGALYYADNGIGSNPPRGAYRLEDLDGSGTIDQPGEVTPFFIAPPQSGNAFHWEITVDAAGTVYLGDNGNELIWRLTDTNLDGVIDPGTEANLFWSAAGASTIWDIDVAADGSLYVAEDQTPDRVLRFVDANADGTIDAATEAFVLYDETVAANAFGSAQAIAVVDGPLVPWMNDCGPSVANSTGASAEIGASGSALVAQNTFVLEASSLPPFQFGLFVVSAQQGFVAGAGGASNGNLCLGGSIGRFTAPSQIQNSGAAGEFALAVDLNAIPQGVGVVGTSPGDTWHFQAWFRDVVGAGSNFTDGLTVTFR